MCFDADTTAQKLDAKTGRVLGTARLSIAQSIAFSVSSPAFVEAFSLRVSSISGDVAGMTIRLTASCGAPCQASAAVPALALRAGASTQGQIRYTDATATRHRTSSTYTLTLSPTSIRPAQWSSVDYRCDRELPRLPGCVVPDYIPTMTSMQGLPQIAANIRRIQANGPHHYGRNTAGGNPLTRNSTISAANNRAACRKRGPAPKGKSCDEYPFASTDQGASKTKFPDWGWAWVPVSEQGSQAGRISGFYNQQRILQRDAFWVAV